VLADRGQAPALRGQAVAQVGEVAALLADRRPVVAHAPPVDRLDERVEPGVHERLGQRGLVLVADSLGKPQTAGVPERAAVDLVPGEHVGEQQRGSIDPGAGERVLVVDAHQRGHERLRAAEALDRSDGEVRAARAERADQQLVGTGQHQVVAVGERQELTAGHRRTGVAGRPQPGVRLVDDPHPGVARGEAVGELAGAVARTVVDDHDLQVDERLVEHAAE
jgi:hypothetical protein